jgi:hypothetical protein
MASDTDERARFDAWWTGRYGEFSIRAEWADTPTEAAWMAWRVQADEIKRLRAEAAEREQIVSDLTLWVLKFMKLVPNEVAMAAGGYLSRKNLPTPLRAALAQGGEK